MSKSLSFEEAVLETMERCGVDEMRARFIVAIERGKISGDCIEVDETGREVRLPPDPQKVGKNAPASGR
jgi:hypothetical protein